MPAPANLVHQTSETTGTGNLTVTTVNGRQSLSDAFGTGGSDVFDYFASNRAAAEWEYGTGHMSDANTLVRDTVIESTNSNAAVDFSAGIKDIVNDIPAQDYTRRPRMDFTPGTDNAYAEGRLRYDSVSKSLAYRNDESEVELNIGREAWVRVYNDSGSTISNGKAVYISGYDSGSSLPEISLADPTASASARLAGVATHDIENSSIGYVTVFGQVNDLDTSGLTAGETIWLDPASPGDFTDTRPAAPNYAIPVGVVVNVDASAGSISVGTVADNGGIERISGEVFNGSVIENPDIDVSSNGTVITLTLENTGGGDLTLVFDSVPYVFDSTPAASATLTAGSDTSPTENFVYIPDSTKALTASTSGWPSEQHVPIATVLCQSASSMQTQNAYKVHKWNDHLSSSDDQGHISHLNRWIRSQDATWISGVAVTPTAGSSQLDIATSAGVVLQLHDHSFPAFDTSSGSVIYVVNDPDTAYTPVASLTQADGVDEDANGGTLGTGSSDFYNLVLWGVVSEDGDDCKLMCNLPVGSYGNNNGNQAENDDANTAVYAIPAEFRGVGFLISRLTIQESGGNYTVVRNTDLRGQKPGLQSGGGAFGGNEFADNVFALYDEGDITKRLNFQLSGVTTATTRTWTVQDAAGTVALLENFASGTITARNDDIDFSGGTDGDVLTVQADGSLAIETVAAGGGITPGTVQATTSGTEFDFAIPAGANRITVIFDSVSLNGTDQVIVQIGDGGGIETTGYSSSSGNRTGLATSTSSFLAVRSGAAGEAINGHMVLTRIDGDQWVESHVTDTQAIAEVCFGGGRKTLSAELTTVRLTRSGTNTFDAGQVNVFYE